jgi:hypothetical protein
MYKNKPAKLNQIDTYTYPKYNYANIFMVGMAQYDTEPNPEAKYESGGTNA